MPAEISHVVVSIDTEFFDSAFLFDDERPAPPAEVVDLGTDGVEFVAELLERHGARGTFFVLGELAEACPDLVADLADRGHEVASHGYSKSHPDLRELPREAVREELASSRRILEEVTGRSITGFRAPAFSIDDDVISVLAETGYEYDSSVVPSRAIPGFYGEPDAPRDPFPSERWFSTPGLTEFPVSVAPFVRLPLSGAWMRLLGRQYAVRMLRRHVRRRQVSVVYVHPWELVELPRYEGIPNRVYWRTGEYTRRTLERIVSEHADDLTTLRALSESGVTRSPGSKDHA